MDSIKQLLLNKITINKTTECWEANTRHPSKYGIGNFLGKRMLLHRLSYQIFNGDIPEGLVIRHKCDNPPCCNPKHLETGTNYDNVQDKIIRERQQSHLKKDAVVKILKNIENKTAKQLSIEFNTSQESIHSIWNRKTWKHINISPNKISNKRVKAHKVLKRNLPILERIQKRLITLDNGCWVAKSTKKGYGQIMISGKIKTLHRASYEEFYQIKLDSHTHIIRTCNTKGCANPKHLFSYKYLSKLYTD